MVGRCWEQGQPVNRSAFAPCHSASTAVQTTIAALSFLYNKQRALCLDHPPFLCPVTFRKTASTPPCCAALRAHRARRPFLTTSPGSAMDQRECREYCISAQRQRRLQSRARSKGSAMVPMPPMVNHFTTLLHRRKRQRVRGVTGLGA